MASTQPPAGSPAGRAGVQNLVDGLKKQYETKDTKEQDQIIESLYAVNATFIDNLAHVHTHKGIQLQFHAVAKFFKTTQFEAKSPEIQEDGKVVVIPCTQTYTMGKRVIPLEATTTLTLNEDGKILKHVDVWKDKFNPWGVWKRFVGSTTSGMYRVFGV